MSLLALCAVSMLSNLASGLNLNREPLSAADLACEGRFCSIHALLKPVNSEGQQADPDGESILQNLRMTSELSERGTRTNGEGNCPFQGYFLWKDANHRIQQTEACNSVWQKAADFTGKKMRKKGKHISKELETKQDSCLKALKFGSKSMSWNCQGECFGSKTLNCQACKFYVMSAFLRTGCPLGLPNKCGAQDGAKISQGMAKFGKQMKQMGDFEKIMADLTANNQARCTLNPKNSPEYSTTQNKALCSAVTSLTTDVECKAVGNTGAQKAQRSTCTPKKDPIVAANSCDLTKGDATFTEAKCNGAGTGLYQCRGQDDSTAVQNTACRAIDVSAGNCVAADHTTCTVCTNGANCEWQLVCDWTDAVDLCVHTPAKGETDLAKAAASEMKERSTAFMLKSGKPIAEAMNEVYMSRRLNPYALNAKSLSETSTSAASCTLKGVGVGDATDRAPDPCAALKTKTACDAVYSAAGWKLCDYAEAVNKQWPLYSNAGSTKMFGIHFGIALAARTQPSCTFGNTLDATHTFRGTETGCSDVGTSAAPGTTLDDSTDCEAVTNTAAWCSAHPAGNEDAWKYLDEAGSFAAYCESKDGVNNAALAGNCGTGGNLDGNAFGYGGSIAGETNGHFRCIPKFDCPFGDSATSPAAKTACVAADDQTACAALTHDDQQGGGDVASCAWVNVCLPKAAGEVAACTFSMPSDKATCTARGDDATDATTCATVSDKLSQVVDSRECLAIDGAGRGTPTIDSGTPMCHYTPKKSLEESTYSARVQAETEMFQTSYYVADGEAPAVPVVQAAKCWRVKETCSGCLAAAHCIEEGRANEKLLDNGCAGLLVGGASACEHASKKTCTGDSRASPAEDLTCQEKIIEGDCTGATNCQWLAVCHWRDEVDMLYQPLHKDCKDANGKNWQVQIPLLGKNSDGTTNGAFDGSRDNDGTDNTNDGTVLECLTDAANPASNVAPYEAGAAGDAGTRGVCSNSNDVAFYHQYSVKSLSKTNNGLGGAGSVSDRKGKMNDDLSMIEGPSTGAALKGLSKAQAKMAKKHLKLKGDCKKCVVKDLDNLIESPESMQSVIDNSYFKNMATGSKKEHKCVAAWAEPSDMELKCLDKASCF